MNRYSLVCNVMITLCNETTDVDRLNDLGVLCAELTAGCNALAGEWLGNLVPPYTNFRLIFCWFTFSFYSQES